MMPDGIPVKLAYGNVPVCVPVNEPVNPADAVTDPVIYNPFSISVRSVVKSIRIDPDCGAESMWSSPTATGTRPVTIPRSEPNELLFGGPAISIALLYGFPPLMSSYKKRLFTLSQYSDPELFVDPESIIEIPPKRVTWSVPIRILFVPTFNCEDVVYNVDDVPNTVRLPVKVTEPDIV